MYQSNQINTNSSIARVISLRSELTRLKAENASIGEIIDTEEWLAEETKRAYNRVMRHAITLTAWSR